MLVVPVKRGVQIYVSFFLYENIFCGCKEKLSQIGESDECHNVSFVKYSNKKNTITF